MKATAAAAAPPNKRFSFDLTVRTRSKQSGSQAASCFGASVFVCFSAINEKFFVWSERFKCVSTSNNRSENRRSAKGKGVLRNAHLFVSYTLYGDAKLRSGKDQRGFDLNAVPRQYCVEVFHLVEICRSPSRSRSSKHWFLFASNASEFFFTFTKAKKYLWANFAASATKPHHTHTHPDARRIYISMFAWSEKCVIKQAQQKKKGKNIYNGILKTQIMPGAILVCARPFLVALDE